MAKNTPTTKRVRLTSDALNSYGSRVLTSGIDISQYERNPVLLYMHRRGEVIGYLDKIERNNDEITAELVFDEVTERSKICKQQWEFGSLRMVSVGIDILEWSEAKEHLVQGQTYPTITRSKLTEVSLVDIGANDDAIILSYQGQQLTLAEGGFNPLPVLNPNPQQSQQMEQKVLALKLGLLETATEQEITAKLDEQLRLSKEAETLRTQLAAQTEAQLTAAIDTAIREKRIEEAQRAHFADLGKKVGLEALQTTLAACRPRVKLSTMLSHQGSAPSSQGYAKLSDVPSSELMSLREEDPEQYKKLFKAEYGFECELSDK